MSLIKLRDKWIVLSDVDLKWNLNDKGNSYKHYKWQECESVNVDKWEIEIIRKMRLIKFGWKISVKWISEKIRLFVDYMVNERLVIYWLWWHMRGCRPNQQQKTTLYV